MNTIFIGVAGGTGSGKTTLTEHLAERFGSNISVVHHDNYYKRQDCSFEERCRQNYDHPDCRFVKHIGQRTLLGRASGGAS